MLSDRGASETRSRDTGSRRPFPKVERVTVPVYAPVSRAPLFAIQLESGTNRGRLCGQRLPVGCAGEPGVPAVEVIGELLVEHSGADLEQQVRTPGCRRAKLFGGGGLAGGSRDDLNGLSGWGYSNQMPLSWIT
jgi:hypothetical protein